MRDTNSKARGGQRGYTLTEALLIVVVVLILSVMAFPALIGATDVSRLNAAVETASGAIKSTRFQAIMKGYPFRLVFNSGTNSYQVSSDPNNTGTYSNVGGAVPVSSSAITLSAGPTLTFKANGILTTTNPSFTVSYKGRSKQITVSNYGSVSVQ